MRSWGVEEGATDLSVAPDEDVVDEWEIEETEEEPDNEPKQDTPYGSMILLHTPYVRYHYASQPPVSGSGNGGMVSPAPGCRSARVPRGRRTSRGTHGVILGFENIWRALMRPIYRLLLSCSIGFLWWHCVGREEINDKALRQSRPWNIRYRHSPTHN